MRELESFCRLKVCLDVKKVLLLAKVDPWKLHRREKQCVQTTSKEKTHAYIDFTPTG